MGRIFFSVLILVLSFKAAVCQSIDTAKLSSYFNLLETNNKFMGSVAVSQHGKLLYTKSIGFSDIDNQVKPNKNTKYRIGSISKTFTTVLVFKAIEQNKLKLTDKIDKYFPSITNAEKITIQHLLSHRSGIHNFTNNSDFLKWNVTSKTEKELTQIIVDGGSDFEPDTKAEYSNSNFVLLTYILQKEFKKDFSKILNEYIIKPIGLKNTYVGSKINVNNNECNSYKCNGNWVKQTETDMSIPLGAGAIVSTPEDLTIFAQALFNGKLISSESVEKMKLIKDNYGMGLFKIPFHDNIGYGHNGGIDGFSSVFSYFPTEQISFALTSNGTNYDNNEVSIILLSSVFNRPFELPDFTTIELTTQDLDKYIGVYSSKDIPLRLTITKNDKTLLAQATGQPAFGLDAAGKDIFKFEKAGVVLEFNTTDNKLILKQGGGTFSFTKE